MWFNTSDLNNKYLFLLFFLTILNFSAQAQLGFCEGNSGDPIFVEDFGQGTQNGPALSFDITSYQFVNQAPQDGEYTISSNLQQLGSFHSALDHTGNTNGKALIVNASDDPITEPGLFYQIPIDGLCINNSYEFSAFLMNVYDADANVCPGGGIPVNVKFQIWDENDEELLAEGDTGDIEGTGTAIWRQFGLTFTTLPGQNSVILKMLNNGQGGCGNDLAIDDIVFKSCGDSTEIISENDETNIQLCENESLAGLTLEANTDFSIYESPSYQWQNSQDGENWGNIPGETNNQLVILEEINSDQFYRALVAEDSANVNEKACNSISTTFQVEKIEFIDPVSLGDISICEDEVQALKVENNPDLIINWYDSENGGNLLASDTFEFNPESSGTYYAEAITVDGSCVNPERLALEYTIFDTPDLFDETITICEGESITLSENFEDVTYLWSNGETGNSIEVDEAGIYSLELTTADNCKVSKDFNVETISAPVIEKISKVDKALVIETALEGDYSFSIDGTTYQSQPVFNSIPGGLYTIYVRENSGCGIVTEEFLFLVIPEFFTPNGDQINDTFKIEGDIYFESFEIVIFDRYGKVIARGTEAPFEWKGTYNGRNMPSDDYWYRILIDGKIYSGNFTLKR